MTKKRFTSQRTEDYNFSDILDDGKWVGICHVDCEDDFVNLLNELHDEKQSVIDWIDNKIEEIKPYNSELCRATLLELKEFLE